MGSDDVLACTFCDTPVFEQMPDGLCVWCRAGFPPSYEAWIARSRADGAGTSA
jgi:hypothetical protein